MGTIICVYALTHLSKSLVFRYHLQDAIVGKIYFLLVRIKIKYMELAIVRRETSGPGDHHTTKWEKKIIQQTFFSNIS